MLKYKKYGQKPYQIAVIHGGPGAAGGMAPVAKTLSSKWNVLEPYQTACSVNGQIKELREIIETYDCPPLSLIGWSWGAWLSYLFTGKYPDFVKKLILVSSGPFKESYVTELSRNRLGRLNKEERIEFNNLLSKLDNHGDEDKEKSLSRLGTLVSKSDNYDPITENPENNDVKVDENIYRKVWSEAVELRSNGTLFTLGKNIRCPVIAIHGRYDPHPYKGVKDPLLKILKDFKFYLLDNCGHTPWIEKQAHEKFYSILFDELSNS